MTKEKYNLKIDEFDSVVKNYLELIGDFIVEKETPNNQIIYRFTKNGEKRFSSILTCYIIQGRVSFLSAGKNKFIAENCMQFIIENTSINVGESRTFTVKPANVDEVKTIVEFLLEECECILEKSDAKNDNIESNFKITGKYKDSIYFTHFKNGTLLVQGRPCFTFLNFIEISTELFNPTDIKREHLKLFEITDGDTIFNSDLSKHLPDAYHHIGNKLDAIMAPSLILLNFPKELTDYSAYAFPVLRGTEGVLKSVFNNEGIQIVKDFGEYFVFDNVEGKCMWAKDCSTLFPDNAFRKSLLDLYRFYHAQRHTLFHVDATIGSTRTLTYEQALEVTQDGLKLINNVYSRQN